MCPFCLLQAAFQLEKADSDVIVDKVTVTVKGPSDDVPCDVRWSDRIASCSFIPTTIGEHCVSSRIPSIYMFKASLKCIFRFLQPLKR